MTSLLPLFALIARSAGFALTSGGRTSPPPQITEAGRSLSGAYCKLSGRTYSMLCNGMSRKGMATWDW